MHLGMHLEVLGDEVTKGVVLLHQDEVRGAGHA